MTEDEAYLQHAFRHFATVCAGQSPLYETLSPQVAEEPALLALAASRQDRQPPVNMLFGAVHDLLLAGAEHELARFYPSVGGREDPADALPVFTDFCRVHEAAILERVSTRRVQTNEVGRCGCLLPGIALAWEHLERRPLHLVEVGCSAGLNLGFDRYRYAYTRDGAIVHECGRESPANVRTEVSGDVEPRLPDAMPRIAGRVGLDIAPVEVTDDEAIRWVEALIWPDQVSRHELFRAAVKLARADPPEIRTGDALDLLPEVLEGIAPDAMPLVYHSHAIYQMSRDWREQFAALLGDLGRARDLAHVALEWLGDDPGPRLELTTWRRGEATSMHLADCHHHGTWLRWVDGSQP